MIEYLIHFGTLLGIYTILSMGLNLAMGYGGLLNLAHIAYFGVGAYAYAISDLAGQPFLLSLCMAILCSGLAGLLLTAITGKLKGDYFALATLGFAFVTFTVFEQWFDLTGGPLGLKGIGRPMIFGVNFVDPFPFLMLVLGLAFLCFLFLYRLVRTPYGKLVEAGRDEPLACQVYGKSPFRLKVETMILSSSMAGIAGALFAMFLTSIEPSTFFLSDIIFILTVVIVGGLGSLWGSVLGALVVFILFEGVSFVDPGGIVAAIPGLTDVGSQISTFWMANLGQMRQILFALLLLVLLRYRPKGLLGRVSLSID